MHGGEGETERRQGLGNSQEYQLDFSMKVSRGPLSSDRQKCDIFRDFSTGVDHLSFLGVTLQIFGFGERHFSWYQKAGGCASIAAGALEASQQPAADGCTSRHLALRLVRAALLTLHRVEVRMRGVPRNLSRPRDLHGLKQSNHEQHKKMAGFADFGALCSKKDGCLSSKKRKVTQGSRVVPHLSTNSAQRCLTSLIRREAVFPT